MAVAVRPAMSATAGDIVAAGDRGSSAGARGRAEEVSAAIGRTLQTSVEVGR